MRIGRRMVQLSVDPSFERLGNEVLQPLGFVVQVFDGVVQHLEEKCFHQPVVPNDLGARLRPEVERRTPSPLVIDVRLRLTRELLKHVRHGGRSHVQPSGQLRTADAPTLIPAQRMDCF